MPKHRTAKNKINYDDLFEIWADFDDEDSQKKVKKLIEEHELGDYDAMSFMGFCYGYQTAMKQRGGENVRNERVFYNRRRRQRRSLL